MKDAARAVESPDWVPARLTMGPRGAALLWTRWRDLEDRPFFYQSVEFALSRGAPALVTPLEAVLDIAARRGGAGTPSGFVYHMSRCGSTAVSNALKRLDDVRVLGEPQPVTSLLAPYTERLWPIPFEHFERSRQRLLRAMLACYRDDRAASRLFCKLTSWNSLHIGVMAAAHPRTPWIYVCRDPIEVLVSNLRRSPGWMKLRRDAAQARWFFGWADPRPRLKTKEGYCASVLGQFCSAAARSLGPLGAVVRYEDLRRSAARAVPDRFGVRVTPTERRRFEESLSLYSKDTRKTRGFVADSVEKQSAATAAMRVAVERWCSAADAELTAGA